MMGYYLPSNICEKFRRDVWYHRAIFPGRRVEIKSYTPQLRCPTDPFTTLELPHNVPGLHEIWQSPDFEALKLWKGRSGETIIRDEIRTTPGRMAPIFSPDNGGKQIEVFYLLVARSVAAGSDKTKLKKNKGRMNRFSLLCWKFTQFTKRTICPLLLIWTRPSV